MASKNVRQLWAAKLAGGGAPARASLLGGVKVNAIPVGTVLPVSALRNKTAGPAPHPLAGGVIRTAFSGQVLGIDPSLRGTGLALIEFTSGRDPLLLSYRTVTVHGNRRS